MTGSLEGIAREKEVGDWGAEARVRAYKSGLISTLKREDRGSLTYLSALVYLIIIFDFAVYSHFESLLVNYTILRRLFIRGKMTHHSVDPHIGEAVQLSAPLSHYALF